MAIPYIGTWDPTPPTDKTPASLGWSNLAPTGKPLGSLVPHPSAPLRTDVPVRPPSNDAPVIRPYAPSGITQFAGYLLSSSGPDDQLLNSAGGFLMYAGISGMFINASPEVGTPPLAAGWNNSVPVAGAAAFPPFNNSTTAAAPIPSAQGPANNTPPVGGTLPPAQAPPNNQPPVGIPLPFLTANNAPPLPA
jgi:hypothetical protein